MLAVGFHEFGSPDVLRVMERPDPVAGAGELVVAVRAAPVNTTDTLMRAGLQIAAMTHLSPPYVAGMEFAGHVHTVGDGVSGFRSGQAVMGLVNPRRPEGGADAQYVVVPAASLVAVSQDADLTRAAAVPMNGLTAIMILKQLNLPAGALVLVTGGAGALGGYVIQLARQAGLRVVADGREADMALLRQLGADHVVPRGDGMAGAVRELAPDGVEGLVDCAMLRDAASVLVRDGGVAVSPRRNQKVTDPRLVVRNVAVTEGMSDTAALARLEDLRHQGVLTPRVALTLPMAEAARAHRMVEAGGLRGRVVLSFP